MKYCIGVDLGGTNIAAGLVDLKEEKIILKKSIKTNAPRPCAEISADIAGLCRDICTSYGITLNDVEWIGVGVPAIIKDGTVVVAVNLEWYDEPFDKILTDLTGRPTFVTNDANAAAYAEAKWGCGAGESSVIAVTLGTGVGGGIVLNGKIWEGFNGSAAELGHMVIEANGRWCGCGQRGCLEAYCSATALISEAKRMAKLYRDSYMRTLVEENGGKMDGIIPFTAAEHGDLAATQVVNDYIGYLAIGIANIINVFQPAVVCIGGGISGQGESRMAPLREKLQYISFGTKDMRTKVVVADFKNDAGIIGAALLGLMEEN